MTVCSQLSNHEKHCKSLLCNSVQAKLVNEYELANMKVKSKPNEMDLVDWIRFKERWDNWKKLQDPGRNLSTSLLDLVQNARNEVTNELGGNYDETAILEAMKNILVRRVNVAEARTNFHSKELDQKSDERMDTYVTRVKDAAVSCNYLFQCPCACKLTSDFSDELMRDRLLVGLYDDDMRVKILEAWDDKTNMSLADLIVKVKRYETAKIAGRRQSNELNAVSAHRRNKMAPKHNNEKCIIMCRKCKTAGHYD